MGAGAVLAGLLTGAAPERAHAADSVPSWLVPMYFDGGDSHRACTGVALTRTRVLAPADCYTGKIDTGVQYFYDQETGTLESGSGSTVYRVHPRYDQASRRADWSMLVRSTPSSFGRAVLASSSDASLYDAGSAATFHSWAGLDLEDAPRIRHSEAVVVKSAAECSSLLGRALPWGTLCTVPAPGAPPVADDDQCFGDAGGALVAGGKLIGISATASTGCVQGGVRLYTSVPAFRGQMTGFSREVEHRDDSLGMVIGREPGGSYENVLLDVCQLRCSADGTGNAVTWNYVFTTQFGDLKGDGEGDWLAKTPAGTLYRLTHVATTGVDRASRQNLGDWWNKFNRLVATRDLSGDGLPDLLARDKDGVVWLYKGLADGSLSGRTKVATWKYYTAIAGRGDYSGDGRNDVVARDGNGVLWLYRGNGRGGFEPRTKVGSGWNKFDIITGSGDMDHNGRQDIIARTPDGAGYLFNADHAGGFYAKKQLTASAWKYYSKIA
ncbi:FG-GAP-like repeat-containing protein [Streptomyces sp. NPDC051940]|uniref:FG-GAP-like repeat-containing protein n=1 Tax=Streptomyces sp. NPDC051940 TaxID=3155675 RepID=UPI0034450895